MKTTIHQRFEIMIKGLGMSKNAFATDIGVASTQVYNIINGRNAPSFDLLSKIAMKYPNVNITWLLTGNGQPMLAQGDVSKDSANLLVKVKQLEDQIGDLQSELKDKQKMDEQTVQKVLKKMMSKS